MTHCISLANIGYCFVTKLPSNTSTTIMPRRCRTKTFLCLPNLATATAHRRCVTSGWPAAWLVLILLLLQGCNQRANSNLPDKPELVFKMGQRIELGQLVYTVLSARWEDSLPAEPAPLIPQQSFLVVRISVTNSGGQPLEVPPLRLVAKDGSEFFEAQAGNVVPGWLGAVRRVQPAETLVGEVVFDVPKQSYFLVVPSGEFLEEKAAWIELPLEFTLQGS